ncbi:MAG: DUF3618 domain-containing protein [Candidatus Krumholzibacteriia bacterium]
MADPREESRSTSEIRRDIEDTRADMHETVDALERKLSPGQLLDQLWDRVGRGGAGAVGDVVREHPVPLAMVGAGLAWLAIEKATDSGRDTGIEDDAANRRGAYGWEPEGSRSDRATGKAEAVKDKAGAAIGAAKDRVGSAVDAVKDKASHAGDAASDQAGGVKDSARSAAHRIGDEASHRGRQVKRGFWSALEEQPLAMGAVAFGLGLASGLSVPGSRWEDRAMGSAAEGVKETAKSAAQDLGESARRVANDTVEAAKQEADRQGVAGNLKESAQSVAQEAKQTARTRAEQEDLDPEGLKSRAAEAGESAQKKSRE